MEKIKLFFICFTITTFWLFNSKQCNILVEPTMSDFINTKYIDLDYVEMDITTFSAIKCSVFNKYFSNILKSKTISDKITINKLIDFLTETIQNNERIKSVDVRGIVKIVNENEFSLEICFGMHGIEIENKKYAISSDFRDFLLKLTDKL